MRALLFAVLPITWHWWLKSSQKEKKVPHHDEGHLNAMGPQALSWVEILLFGVRVAIGSRPLNTGNTACKHVWIFSNPRPSQHHPRPPTFKNTGQTQSVIFFWQQSSVSQMDFIWQLKGVNMCLDSEVPPDNGYIMLARLSQRTSTSGILKFCV